MTKLSVPDMSCGHCRASVEQALGQITDVGAVHVDLETRTVRIDGPASPESLRAALDGIGFPSQVIA